MLDNPNRCSPQSTGSRSERVKQRIRMIFSAYRRDDFVDPEGFLIQLGMVLERYDDAVIEYVSDPRTGIQRTAKFPPSIAEVVAACDSHAEHLATLERLRSIPNPHQARLPAPARPRWNLFVGRTRPRFDEMAERAKDADRLDYQFQDDGIWIPVSWWWEGKGVKSRPRQFTVEDLKSIYASHGEGA